MFDEKFWLAVSFFIFIALIYKPVKNLLTKQLDNRSALIKKELDEVLILKEEAELLLASYKRKQEEAESEIAQILDHADREVKRLITEAHSHFDQFAERRSNIVMKNISDYENSIISSLEAKAIDSAIAVTVEYFEENLNDSALTNRLIENSITQVNAKF